MLADLATLTHYYVDNTAEVGFYVYAEIRLNKKLGKGFVVKVKGPFKHPRAEVFHAAGNNASIWRPMPRANNGGYARTEDWSSSNSYTTVGQIGQQPSNRGLINSNGYTQGHLNNSVFLNCHFSKFDK